MTRVAPTTTHQSAAPPGTHDAPPPLAALSPSATSPRSKVAHPSTYAEKRRIEGNTLGAAQSARIHQKTVTAKPQLRNKPIRRKANPLGSAKTEKIDCRDIALSCKFISDHSKTCAHHVASASIQEQRKIARVVKNTHEMTLLPYSTTGH